jgi:hypothetical protein
MSAEPRHSIRFLSVILTGGFSLMVPLYSIAAFMARNYTLRYSFDGTCKCFYEPYLARNVPSPGNSPRCITAVLERVLISHRCSRRRSAVHPAAAVRGGLTPAPASCPCAAPLAEVHGQFLLHGVVPPIFAVPHPRVSPLDGHEQSQSHQCRVNCRLPLHRAVRRIHVTRMRIAAPSLCG